MTKNGQNYKYYYKSMRLSTDLGEKMITKWEHINNKCYHSHLGIPHSPFPCISLAYIPSY